MNPGTHTVKVKDYILAEKNDRLQFEISFGATDGASIKWFGGFKEGKNREITLKTLMTLGLTNADQLSELAKGPASGLIDMEKEYSIVVENQTYEGKTKPRVKFINTLGGLSKAAGLDKISSLIKEARGEFAQMAKDNGIKTTLKNYAPGSGDIKI